MQLPDDVLSNKHGCISSARGMRCVDAHAIPGRTKRHPDDAPI